MRFTGVMNDIMCIRQFASIVNAVARLSKTCVLRITTTHLYLIANEAGIVNSSPGLWAELDQGHFFNVFNMGGVSEENNEIFLEMEPDTLSKTLSSFTSTQTAARFLKIKLTKKHSPCLTLEVELPSLSVHARIVVHDVPVRPLPRRQWSLYQEPEMPQCDASLYLPPLKQLRHVVERMKTQASHITLAGNRRGTLVFSMSTDTVTVSTYFRHLSMPTWDRDDGGRDGEPEELRSATVDIKRLALFLTGEQIGPSKVICNIVEGRLIHMFLLHEDVTLQYFLPAATNVY
ncbi:hypothetical protein Pmani_008401 [Petrolisthes manimaculis]|uniref:Checkpoint protein n=1 Tax=Petrolisthes manimaculis TaxID=1843537 RepID=A0AAE1Q6Q3_9EUCA|nr:hypothetical protein Pmani_008401 [Petrolisthes manimaculis]